MSINLSDTTPAAPAANANVKWQTDVSGNVSGYVSATGTGIVNAVGIVIDICRDEARTHYCKEQDNPGLPTPQESHAGSADIKIEQKNEQDKCNSALWIGRSRCRRKKVAFPVPPSHHTV